MTLYSKTHAGFLILIMKRIIDGIIVVEGTGDSSYLSSFIDALFIETNGYDVKDEDIDFLQHCNKKIIILTDSDEAGESIRTKLNKKLPNAINVRVNSNMCNKNGKHGVAECKKEEILNVLKEHFIKENKTTKKMSLSDLISITKGQKEIKKWISNFYHLGTTNNKEILKRINLIGLTVGDIKKEVSDQYGNK